MARIIDHHHHQQQQQQQQQMREQACMNILLKVTRINVVFSTTDIYFFSTTLQWRVKVKLYFDKFNNKPGVSRSRIFS